MSILNNLLHIINHENNKEIDNAINQFSIKTNIKTDKEIIFGNEEYLISKTGINKKTFDIIKKKLINHYSNEIINGEDLYNEFLKEKKKSKDYCYSFGNKNIDKLINGGVQPGDIIELVGSPSTGKTQLSLLLLLNVLVSDSNNTALYLDTRGSFSIKRLINFYYSGKNSNIENNEDIKNFLLRIQHQSVYNYFELFSILEKVIENIKNSFNRNLKLIIINSISSLIFPITQDNYTRNSIMSSINLYINILAKRYNISILITNFTVGANNNNLSIIPTNSLEYYNKKLEFYKRQQTFNLKIKKICEEKRKRDQEQYIQNQSSYKLIENQEDMIKLLNNFNDDFPMCVEINKTFSNTVIRENKKPSLGNIWTYTPDIQLFLTSLPSLRESGLNNTIFNNNNYNNRDNNNIDEIIQSKKKQKLNKYKNIEINEVFKKIEVILSHKTSTGQNCIFTLNEKGIF
ncbi:P-loop containing nucleoside triphosphate hydrolase protein [Piromyces finnis]|uniref:p-loop containing nucleoside triphosphate hydrolase protein n=1 Tax=Piromyces finnis TaxID=1754191 RepID=A0A1Y1V150_9FUNG|nr:P-loop containing nucleoside triphosphate hydrolase protein [Piromyces finnis]|eukprot:ORX44321.1 P-loop containing nucleoside triphosphate hydrolase protein [Piromyces finnis]